MTQMGTYRPKVLMACPLLWESPVQIGTHHLARGFVSEGWDVSFISSPLTPFHLATQKWGLVRGRLRNYLQGGTYALGGHLWSYCPGALITPKKRFFFDSRFVFEYWKKTILPPINRKLSRKGFERLDLLYFDNPGLEFLLDDLNYSRSVFRVADNYHEFGEYPDQALKAIARIAQRVDLVVYTACSLKEYVKKLGAKKVYCLPNGVNYEHFAHGDRNLPPEMAAIKGPIAIYVGSIEKWFDFELLDRVSAYYPNISFIIIGPKNKFSEKISTNKNVYFLGPKSFAEIPRYLHNADIGLIPFNVKINRKLLDCVNPLKLYEYFSCGLPVVATAWEELRILDSPAILCDSVQDFIAGVETALHNPISTEALQGYARCFDWNQKVRELIAVCKE